MSEAIAHILWAVQTLGNNTTGVVLVTSTRSLEYWTNGGKKVVDQSYANPCKKCMLWQEDTSRKVMSFNSGVDKGFF